MFPDAMSPEQYLTGHGTSSVWLVWLMFWMAAIVGFQYIVILFRWYYSYKASWVQISLMSIFLLCAIGSYWMYNLSFFYPNIAYTIRLLVLFLLFICNMLFIGCSFGKRFHIASSQQEVCRRVVTILNRADVQDADIHQLASELRGIVSEMRTT